MPRGGPHHRAGDRVELRRPARRDVALHRAAERRRARGRARRSPSSRRRRRPRRARRRPPPPSSRRGPRAAPASSGSPRAACRRRSSCRRARSGARASTTSRRLRSRGPWTARRRGRGRSASSRIGSGDGRRARHADQQERARVDDDARLGPVGLDADRARQHGVGGEAPPQHREVVEAVEQRQHERGLDLDPLERLLEARAPWSRRAARRPARSGSRPRAGRTCSSPNLTLLTAMPRAAITSAVDSCGDDDHLVAVAVERRREQPSDAARAEHRDLHGSSTPGFSTPAGSTRRFAARSAAGEGLGALAFVPRPVIAPDGVVVGDRRALLDQHVRDRPLDRAATARPPRRAAPGARIVK